MADLPSSEVREDVFLKVKHLVDISMLLALRALRALRYATEVADALDTADRRGIVHRDLKPGNIFIMTHGESKVLDFGLAKLEEQTVDGETPTAVETSPEVLTTPGSAMGTVAYMSPEQARGEELDGRTDIFSLGGGPL